MSAIPRFSILASHTRKRGSDSIREDSHHHCRLHRPCGDAESDVESDVERGSSATWLEDIFWETIVTGMGLALVSHGGNWPSMRTVTTSATPRSY